MHCQLSPNYTKVLVATSLMHYCFNGAGSAEEPFSQTHVVLFAGADDWEEAYQSLRQIVMEDLLLEEEEEGQRSSKVGTSTGIYSGISSLLSSIDLFKRIPNVFYL